MALKKQATLTQYGKGSHSDDSEGEQQEQNGAPTHRQQGDPEGPPANDAEHQMMVQAAASAFESNGAADNDGGKGGNENYDLSQEDFDELTQQFGDHSHYDDSTCSDDDAEEQDADAEVDKPDDRIQHRDLTQEILVETDEEGIDDEIPNGVDGAPNNDSAQRRKSRQSLLDGFVQPTPAKRRRLNNDTENKVTIKMRRLGNEEKTFEKGEVHRSSVTSKLFKSKTFIIEQLSGETTKYAECRVFVKFTDTYAGTSTIDRFLGNKKNPRYEYVFFKKTQKVRLQDLDEGPFHNTASFPPLEGETLVWHPNEKGNIGVGFKVAYTLSMKERMELKANSPPAPSPAIIPCLDLFAGAGGMSVGLGHAAGSQGARLSVDWAVENEPNAATTWRMNHPPDPRRFGVAPICFCEDTRDWFEKVKRRERPYTDIKPKHIHGSPPCQGYSRANRNGGANDDTNRAMTKLFFDICLYFKPDTISMENVDNILSPEHEIFLKEGMDRLIEAEYQCVLLNVSAASFGDPQERKRCILIAVKKTMPFDPNMLKATHGEEDVLKGFVKPANVLGDLEDVEPVKGGVLRSPGTGDLIYDHVERGTNLPRTESGDLNEKEIVTLEGDKPAKTLTKSNRMQHYKQKSRGLTIRELARLQSFPDTFLFAGDVQAQRDQIGNAVPCMLAKAIGQFILRSYVPEDENTEE